MVPVGSGDCAETTAAHDRTAETVSKRDASFILQQLPLEMLAAVRLGTLWEDNLQIGQNGMPPYESREMRLVGPFICCAKHTLAQPVKPGPLKPS